MKILPDTLLKDRYDVVVVGAGLGGMTAASLLAKRGVSVLMIEQQNKPGGACTSFKREDHVFDVGAAMLYGFGEKGSGRSDRYSGQVLYQHLRDEILIDKDQAYGVRLQNGAEIRAERVIANTTVWNIYGKLVRPEHIPPERLKWAQSLVPTFPSMTLYMVVDCEGIPDGIFPWEIFLENRKVIDSSDLTLYINSLVDATLCPPG